MIDRKAIVRFVRESLGCGCPDEVFESLRWGIVDDGSDHPRRFRVDVGGRLLVEVIRGEKLKPEKVMALSDEGRMLRDEGGYNRFRLVIVGEEDAALRTAFEQAAAGDEKLHLHQGNGEDFSRFASAVGL